MSTRIPRPPIEVVTTPGGVVGRVVGGIYADDGALIGLSCIMENARRVRFPIRKPDGSWEHPPAPVPPGSGNF